MAGAKEKQGFRSEAPSCRNCRFRHEKEEKKPQENRQGRIYLMHVSQCSVGGFPVNLGYCDIHEYKNGSKKN